METTRGTLSSCIMKIQNLPNNCLLSVVLSWTPRRLVTPFILVTAESVNPAGYYFTDEETKLQFKE